MILNLEEPSGKNKINNIDWKKKKVINIITPIVKLDSNSIRVFRIGAATDDNIRPLRFILPYANIANQVLRNTYKVNRRYTIKSDQTWPKETISRIFGLRLTASQVKV